MIYNINCAFTQGVAKITISNELIQHFITEFSAIVLNAWYLQRKYLLKYNYFTSQDLNKIKILR